MAGSAAGRRTGWRSGTSAALGAAAGRAAPACRGRGGGQHGVGVAARAAAGRDQQQRDQGGEQQPSAAHRYSSTRWLTPRKASHALARPTSEQQHRGDENPSARSGDVGRHGLLVALERLPETGVELGEQRARLARARVGGLGDCAVPVAAVVELAHGRMGVGVCRPGGRELLGRGARPAVPADLPDVGQLFTHLRVAGLPGVLVGLGLAAGDQSRGSRWIWRRMPLTGRSRAPECRRTGCLAPRRCRATPR